MSLSTDSRFSFFNRPAIPTGHYLCIAGYRSISRSMHAEAQLQAGCNETIIERSLVHRRRQLSELTAYGSIVAPFVSRGGGATVC